MSVWTSVKTWASAVVSVADMQTYVSDNTNYLKDHMDLAPQRFDRQVSLQTVANTVTETAVYTKAVAGGTLGTDKMLEFTLIGDQINNSGGATTMRIKVKYGATTIYDASFTNVNAGANRGPIHIHGKLCAASATNSQRAEVNCWVDPLNEGTVSGIAITKDFVGGSAGGAVLGGGTFSFAVHNNIGEDSTASKNLVITFQNGNASASIDMRAHIVEVTLR